MATEVTQNGDGDQAVKNVLNDLDMLKEASSPNKTDTEILQALVNNPLIQTLAKAHTAMMEKKIQPTTSDAAELCERISEYVDELDGDPAYQELNHILTKPHLMHLLRCHDIVAKKNKATVEQLHGTATNANGSSAPDSLECQAKLPKAIRMVGMYKKSWEPLGLTVVKENNMLKIARILHGSDIEKKGLLHVDDIIMEVNGHTLNGDPKQLQDYLLKTEGSVILKIVPSYEENLPPKLLYIKCHIDYDPKSDDYIPCVEAGMEFSQGDILQVVDQTDQDWWQAQRVNNKGEARARAGLIPSQSFEEKRRAMKEMNNKALAERKKSRKRKSLRTMYSAAQNAAFDKHDIAIYEEVACIPPFSRKTLILLMQSRNLAEEISRTIVNIKPEMFAKLDEEEPEAVASTSLREVTSEELHSENLNTHNSELKSARYVLKEGKTCVLVATPQCLKLLRTSEFMPYVVFVKTEDTEETAMDEEDQVFRMSNADIGKYYTQYIDAVIDYVSTPAVVNDIIEKMEQLKSKNQWVPTSWVY